jgi:uncharacterized protein YjiS (DUF1127 family)
MVEVWDIIKNAGPLALACAFFFVWWLERTRANDERSLNEKRTDKLYDLGISTRDALKELNTLLEARRGNP